VNDLLTRLRAAWDNLSPRERILLSGVGAIVMALLVFTIVVNPILGAAESAQLRVAEAEQQSEVMQRLRSEFDGIQSRLSSVEQRIRSGQDGAKIRTLLDSLATKSAVNIDSMEERQAGENDIYSETKVEVSLKNVTLTQTVNYLHNIESSDRVLSVKSLRVKNNKRRAGDAELLDVTFTVSSFEPI
jgi:type II secretory pathway component PulM